MAEFSLNPKQRTANRLLGGPQRHILGVGGARSGKTFLFTRAIVARAMFGPHGRHAMFRYRANAARASIALDTLPTVVRRCWPTLKLKEYRQDGFYELPNESQIWVSGLDDKARVEKILGLEFVTMLFNETSQIPYSSVLVARTRLAQNIPGLRQRAYYDLNPVGTGHWTNQEFGLKRSPVDRKPLPNPDDFVRFFLNPEDNRQNLSPEFLASLAGLPARQRKRFYEGLYVDEIDGALWSLDRLDAIRCELADVPDLQRIVVAIDPSGARGPEDKRSDEIGIVVAGLGVDGRCYVLEDLTCRLGPAGWARRAVQAYYRWRADAIIAETNFGGALVEETIRTADPDVPFREVHASRGKVVRAEPVAALYEEKIDKVRHVGPMPDLEDQLCEFSVSGYTGERSPDRADAMVWAISELMLGHLGSGEALLEVVRRQMREERAAAAAPTPVETTYAVGSVEHMKQLMG